MVTTDPRPSPWRKVRLALLLAVLAGVGVKYLLVRRAERWVPDWRATQQVTLVLLAPASTTADERDELERLTRFARLGDDKATLSALEHWFEVELGRYVARPGFRPVQLRVSGPHPYTGAPPAPPRAGEELAFKDRYRRTRDFLGWYEERLKDVPGRFPTIVFVTFYGVEAAHVFQGVHSVADRRSRRGFVFAPLTDQGRDAALINVAHELLHLFGATDKYDGDQCVYPEGWVEPFREPRLPQRFAEVMAQGIPVAAGRSEASLDLFEAMRVGVETAREIGWIDQARRDRYYAGDASAGPRLD